MSPPTSPLVSPEAPWLGLRYFTEDLREYFFGRDRELVELHERVLERPLTVLFGQSGLGKTSLIQAGLVPRLREDGYVPVLVRLDHTRAYGSLGEQVVDGFYRDLAIARDPAIAKMSMQELVFSPGFDLKEANRKIRQIVGLAVPQRAADDPRGIDLWELLHDPRFGYCGGAHSPRIVLILDQFEEIFTLGETTPERRAASHAFLESLADVLENRVPESLRARLDDDLALADRLDFSARPLKALLSLRDDFLHRLERWRTRMPSVMENRFELRLLTGPQALEAVLEPAKLRCRAAADVPPIVDPPTGEAIVRFVANVPPDRPLAEIDAVPPLLSLLCAELNAGRGSSPVIRLEQLEGRAEDILAHFYERCLAPHPPALAHFIEDRLLSPEGFRQAVNQDTFLHAMREAGIAPERARELLDSLVQSRLLVREDHGQDGRTGSQRIELTHDTLTGVVRRSRDLRRQREESERRRKRRIALLWTLALSAAAVAAISVPLAWWALNERDNARHLEEKVSKALALAKEAEANTQEALSKAESELDRSHLEEARAWIERADAAEKNKDSFKAALLAARAIGFVGYGREDAEARGETVPFPALAGGKIVSYEPEREEVLRQAREIVARNFDWFLLWSSPVQENLRGAISLAFSSDGTRLAAANSYDIKIWDATSGQELATLYGGMDLFTSVAMSPDGSLFASGNQDRTVSLWDAASGELLAKLSEYSMWVTSVAFSSDGRRLASGSTDGVIRIWDIQNGAKYLGSLSHGKEVTSVAFSPNGRRLASGGEDNTTNLFDIESGEVLATFIGHGKRVTSVVFSPDGQRLASGSEDNTIKLWSAESGKEIATLKGHTSSVTSVTYSSDGRFLASGSEDSTVRLWDIASEKTLATLDGHGGSVLSVAFSPDGRSLASGSEHRTVRLWSTSSGIELAAPVGHEGSVASVAWNSDGRRLASGSADSTVRLWDAATGEALFTLSGHEGEVTSIAFSPDGQRLASGSEDETIKIWNMVAGEWLATLTGHKGTVTSVAFSPDGQRLASGSEDESIKIWNMMGGEELATLTGHRGTVTSVTFSPDGSRLASASGDQTIRLWDAASGAELTTLPGHTSSVTSVAYSPDGQRLASGSEDMTVRIWDATNKVALSSFVGHKASVRSVAFCPGGIRLASGSWDGSVKVWDTTSGKELATLADYTRVMSVAFSPDGVRLASGSLDQTVKIWDTSSERASTALTGHENTIYSVGFSPDGRRLASGSSDTTIKLWDTTSWKELTTLAGHDDQVMSVAFNLDGSRLASGGTGEAIKIWDADRGVELVTLTGHRGAVLSVAFSPHGSRLASGSADNTVKLWDTTSWKELKTLTGHESGVTSIAFTPDGSRLVSGSHDSSIKLWDEASGNELLTLAGNVAPHRHSIESIAFSPGGKYLASGGYHNTVKLWETSNWEEAWVASSWTKATPLTGLADDGTVTSLAFSPDARCLAIGSPGNAITLCDTTSGKRIAIIAKSYDFFGFDHTSLAFSPNGRHLASGTGSFSNAVVEIWDMQPECAFLRVRLVDSGHAELTEVPLLDVSRSGLWRMGSSGLESAKSNSLFSSVSFPMLHPRNDELAQLARPDLTPLERASLQISLCIRTNQWRAAIHQWHLATAATSIPADAPIRLDYCSSLLIHAHDALESSRLADATKLLTEAHSALTAALASAPSLGLPLHIVARALTALPAETDLTPLAPSALALLELAQPHYPDSPEFGAAIARLKADSRAPK